MILLIGGGAAFLVRVVVGPSLADRVVALDGLIAVVLGAIIVGSVRDETTRYLGVALVVAFVGFVGTVASARFVEGRSRQEQESMTP